MCHRFWKKKQREKEEIKYRCLGAKAHGSTVLSHSFTLSVNWNDAISKAKPVLCSYHFCECVCVWLCNSNNVFAVKCDVTLISYILYFAFGSVAILESTWFFRVIVRFVLISRFAADNEMSKTATWRPRYWTYLHTLTQTHSHRISKIICAFHLIEMWN